MLTAKPSPLVDARVIYCGENLEPLRKLPDGCVDLIYIDPPPPPRKLLGFNSNRNYEVSGRETKEKRGFEIAPNERFIVAEDGRNRAG